MFGEVLKEIREGKNMTIKEVSEGIMTASQLRKIENGGHVTSAENHLSLLNRLNTNTEEFSLLTGDDYLNLRPQLKISITEALRKKNTKEMKSLINVLDGYVKIYKDNDFTHMRCLLKAEIILLETNHDFDKAREVLAPVKSYLDNINQWYYYELKLLNNILYFYPFETIQSMGKMALDNIKSNYNHFKNHEVTRALLNNLAVVSLDKGELMMAYDYSTSSLALPNSTNHLYESSFARVVNQVVCYKMQNDEYEEEIIASIISFFSAMKMKNIEEMLKSFVLSHGIVI